MELKTNDILDVSLKISDEESNETKYSITYWHNGLIYSSADVSMPKDSGYIDIEEWISQDIDSFPEISDYDVFDIIDMGEYHSAKIRIKSLKE